MNRRSSRRHAGAATLRVLLAALLLASAPCGDPSSPAESGPRDPDRLLTDDELRTPRDDFAPPENPVWTAWVEESHQPIRSLTSRRPDDLAFLDPLLSGRRIVALGESGHGVGPFSRLKVRLVRYLHERLGFDVIAFESPLYECFQAERSVATAEPRDVLEQCLFRVWHTEDVLELFEYLAETRATSRPLHLAGFDIQMTAPGVGFGRPAFLGGVAGRVDADYGERVVALDSALVAESGRGEVPFALHLEEREAELVAAYDSLADFLRANRGALAAGGAEAEREAMVAERVALTVPSWVRQLIERRRSGSGAVHRDPAMADNLTFLLEELYPGERVVVWAHNFHVRKRNENVVEVPVKAMGSWVRERYGDAAYAVGLYMYTGSAADNNRRPYLVERARSGSLESIAYHARKRWIFLALSGAAPSPGSEWLFTPRTANAWGTSPATMVLRDQYDGILFVHTATTPPYLPPR